MRAVLHVGTSSCSTALEDALSGHVDPLLILVPAEPRLLGPLAQADGIAQDVTLVAQLLLDRVLDHARTRAAREAGELAGVFGQQIDPEHAPVDAVVVEAGIGPALLDVLEEHGATELYASRDILELLSEAGVRIDGLLEGAGIDLVAR